MPLRIEYPLKNRDDWKKKFLPRLNPDSPARFPLWWDSVKKDYQNRDYPLGVPSGSVFGFLRNWMGVENIATMLYDDPNFIREMMEYLADFFVTVLKRVVFDVQFDFANLWEDMAYKTGPLISPKHVKEFMVPCYRKVVELLHKAGIDIIWLDCDGNVEELIPIWLDCGINFIYPMEVAAGMDVVRLRKKFGKNLLMAGGMDKRVLAQGKQAIKKMVDGKRDLICEGGYIPGCDHAVPPDVSWDNFLYFRRLVSEIRP
jgi:uroporphyrinogen decarboxylase